MKKLNWRKYALEFLSIFIAVISAFALNNWNDNRNDSNSETKILTEIRNSIDIDSQDFSTNILGNRMSLRADQLFRNLLAGADESQDSIGYYYTVLFRDYIPIINRSAYESLKANGIKIVSNDSLRIQIISLYDYYYTIIEALEYEVPEMQSFGNYFTSVNTLIYPNMEFDPSGNLIAINDLGDLSEKDKKEILSYLWRIRNNRNFKLSRYSSILEVMDKVKKNIDLELASKS